MPSFDISAIYNDMKPFIVGLFNDLNQASGSGGSGMSIHDLNGSFHSGTLDIIKVPDALNRNGDTLLGDLSVATGVLIDGVDLSDLNSTTLAHIALNAVAAHGTVGAHNHQTTANGGTLDHGLALTGLSDDDHTQYMHNSVNRTVLAQHTFNPALPNSPFILGANAQNQLVTGLYASSVNKNVYAGLGMTNASGVSLLTADVTLNIGSGTGITVNADDIAINQAFSPTWSGNHTWTNTNTFENTLTTRHLIPQASYSYDIGLLDKMYRKAWIAELQALVFAENTIQVINGEFLISKDGGSLAADALAAATTMNFGKSMTSNDFVVFQDVGKYEKIQVGTLVSGTTYNVTRNMDGSGANDWYNGAAFAVLGFTGNGYISLSATTTPRQSFWLHGADYDDITELGRFGDLNGNWGYATTKYGLAWGRYQVAYPNLVFDEDGTFAIRRFNTDILRFDSTANYLSNPLLLGTDGGIYQGTGTFISPTRGLKLSNSGGYGVLEGYNSGTVQAAFNSSGEITWGAGVGTLNASGARITASTSGSISRGLAWYSAIDNNIVAYTSGWHNNLSANRALDIVATGNSTTSVASVNIQANATTGYTDAYLTISQPIIEGAADSVDLTARAGIAGLYSQHALGVEVATTTGPAVLYGTTVNIGTTTTTAINLGRSAATLIDASPTAFTNQPTSIPTFSGDGLYFLLNTSNRGFDGLWERNSGTSTQLSIPHVTAFPSSPTTNLTVYRTDYRSLWNYDGSAWRQVSQGAFSGSFPSSPQDDMRVWRSDRNIEYFYNNATSQWLSTEIFTASEIGDVRVLSPYTNALTVATAVNTFHVDNDVYSIRVVDSYITSMTTATNSGTHYWNYSIGYANNNGGGGVTLVSGNTSAAAANSTTRIAISDVTIASNATAGRVAVTLNVTGSPTTYTIRGIIKYRFVG
jgi:hypothetical protein